MGIQSREAGGKFTLINYVNKAGCMVVGNEVSAKAIKEGIVLAGMEQKDSFDGTKQGAKSAILLTHMAGRGVTPVTVSGKLLSVAHKSVVTDGIEVHKVGVILGDEEGKYAIFQDVNTGGGQMLLDKLYSVKPGDVVDINMFATYEQGTKKAEDGSYVTDPSAGLFTQHGATVRDASGNEIKFSPERVAARAALNAKIKAKYEVLKANDMDNKDNRGAAKKTTTVEAYVALTKAIEAKFATPEAKAEMAAAASEKLATNTVFDVNDLMADVDANAAPVPSMQ